MSLQGHRARVPSETSLGVVGLVSDLFREVSEETLYTSEETLRSVRVGWVGGIFQRASEVSGMEWCTSQRTSETFRVLCGIIGGVKN